MALLNAGDRFPDISFTLPGGGMLELPAAFSGRYGVVLFYRGSWCPFCNTQLRAFQRALDTLTEAGAMVVAVSVDDEATTAALIEKHHVTFPVAYGAHAHEVAARTGAFVNADSTYLQSTGFVLAPDGTVVVSVYSSGAIGRLLPDDVTGLIGYHRGHTTYTT